jgi:hypothetical protein
MAIKIAARKAEEVPTPTTSGKANPDLAVVKAEMSKLAPGMVLEIVPDSGRGVRGTKMLISKAAKELGTPWRHWSIDSTVYAMPAAAPRRRTRKANASAS